MTHTQEAVLVFASLAGMAGFFVSLICVSVVVGMARATHTVQYVPHDNSTADLIPQSDILKENEEALLDKVGKKKREQPTVVEDLDAAVAEVAQSDVKF